MLTCVLLGTQNATGASSAAAAGTSFGPGEARPRANTLDARLGKNLCF